MYKFVTFLVNRKGDVLTNASCAIINRSTNERAPVYSDEGGTPLGNDNLLVPESTRGLVEAYVDDGIYHIDFFKDAAASQFDYRIPDYPMVADLSGQVTDANAAREGAEAAQAGAIVAKQGAEAAETGAEGYAAEAAASLQAALAAGRVFDDETAALAGTDPGDNLFLREDGNFVEYVNDSDTDLIATGITVAGAAALFTAVSDVQSAAATVGTETGNSAARAALGGVASDTVTNRAVARYATPQKAFVANKLMSEQRAVMHRTTRAIGHSAIQGSGVVLAGAAIHPQAGINGSICRYLHMLLQAENPEWRVINHGVSAQTSAEIAARMGAIPIYITLGSGTTLASSGAVLCTATPGSMGPFARRGTSTDELYGYIGTQLCRLINTGTGVNANTVVYNIEQIGGTASITVNANTPFIASDSTLDFAVNVIWATRNDVDVQMSYDMVGAMVAKLPQDEKRFVVMGNWPFSTSLDGNPGTASEDTGTTKNNTIIAENAQMRLRYGGDFFDVYKFLRGEYPYDGTIYRSIWQVSGATASANDLADIAAGIIPRQWMSFYLGGGDYNHFNENTYYWLAVALIEFHYKPKGWLA